MRRARAVAGRIGDTVAIFGQLHIAAIIGALAALTSDVFVQDAAAKILIGLVVTIVVRQVGDLVIEPRRHRCGRDVAAKTRTLLDAHLQIGFLERAQSGRWLTLRELAAAAKAGQLIAELAPGTDAYSLAETTDGFAASFKTEVSTCYARLRGKAQSKIDRLTSGLGAIAAAARIVSTFGPSSAAAVDPAGANQRDEGYKALGDALELTVAVGEDLDRDLDPKGAHEWAQVREAAAKAQRDVEARALDVLVANARSMVDELHRGDELEGLDPAALASRLRAARDIGLEVDAAAFHDASTKARWAHRRITYEDLFDALEMAVKLEQGQGEPGAKAKIRELVDRVPSDLAALERLREKRL